MLGLEVVEEVALPLPDVLDLDVVEIAVGDGEDDRHLLLDRHRPVLRLLEHLDQPGAAGELPLGGGVEVGAELGEGLELAVLRQRSRSGPATCFIALICALPPTRLTLMPASTAGRTLE